MSGSTWGKPVKEVLARLEYQAESGRLLDGWAVVPFPRTEASGPDDYPSVRLQACGVNESGQNRNQSAAKVTLVLEVAVTKEDGLAVILDGLARVCDALERDLSDKADGFIEKTSPNATVKKTDATMATGNALYGLITLTFDTIPYNRSSRLTA